MKIVSVGLLFIASHAWADDKHASFGMLGGQYSYTHTVSSFDHGDQDVTDRLLLEHDGYDGYDAEIHLKFDFGSECSLIGSAQLIEGSQPARLRFIPQDDTAGCMVDIMVDDAALTLADGKNSCRSYCGVGGSVDGVSFARTTKAKLE